MKKIILIILMFISVNVFSQTLTTYYSFKTYPTSINKNIYWYGVNFSRIDSVLHLLATGGTSFDLTAFHSFSGINNFTNGTTFSDSVRMTRLSVDTLTITSGKIDSARIPSTVKIDTAKFAHTDTLTTESVRSVWNFWNIVAYYLPPTVSSFFQDAARTIQYFLPNSASDTLVTRSQTQTLTNKTIANSSNTITGLGKSYINISYNTFNPADATTYYIGGPPFFPPSGTESGQRIYFPTACTITAVGVYCWKTVAASNEAISFYLRKNNTTDSTLTTSATWQTASGYDHTYTAFTTGMSISAGDWISIKMVCPTWATNPTGCYVSAMIEVKNNN